MLIKITILCLWLVLDYPNRYFNISIADRKLRGYSTEEY